VILIFNFSTISNTSMETEPLVDGYRPRKFVKIAAAEATPQARET
jgi:hypothetical protein